MIFPKEDMELTLFTKYLKLSGLWLDVRKKCSKYLRVLQWSRLVTSVVSLAVWDWGMSRVEPKDIPQKPYAAILLWLNLNFLCMCDYTSHCWLVEDFVEGMSALLRKRTKQEELLRFQELTSRLWKVITVWVTCHCGFAMIAVSCGYIIVDVVLYVTTAAEEPFYIGMTLEAFLPEKKVRNFLFYALGVLNTCLMLIPAFYHIALLGALPITVTYVYFEFEVLKKNVNDWFNNINNPEIRQRMLKEIVDDYCELIRLSRIMKTLLGFFYLVHCLITVVTLGFLFHLFKKAATKGEIVPLCISTFLIVTTTLIAYIACYIGEKLHEEGQKMSMYIYEFEWYRTSPEVMRTVKFIMMQSQMPLSINFKNRVQLSLDTFTEVMNKGYTLFLLLDSFNL